MAFVASVWRENTRTFPNRLMQNYCETPLRCCRSPEMLMYPFSTLCFLASRRLPAGPLVTFCINLLTPDTGLSCTTWHASRAENGPELFLRLNHRDHGSRQAAKAPRIYFFEIVNLFLAIFAPWREYISRRHTGPAGSTPACRLPRRSRGSTQAAISFSTASEYCPMQASPLQRSRWCRARWAAATFSALPAQVVSAGSCRARP